MTKPKRRVIVKHRMTRKRVLVAQPVTVCLYVRRMSGDVEIHPLTAVANLVEANNLKGYLASLLRSNTRKAILAGQKLLKDPQTRMLV